MKNIITEEDFEAMNPAAKHVGIFFCNFKVHKQHEPNKEPPERPIVSTIGSVTENIGKFVQHLPNPLYILANSHETFLEDTPDLSRRIEDINNHNILQNNAILMKSDVIGLFPNIPQNDGAKATEEALEERENKEVPTHFLTLIYIMYLNMIHNYTYNSLRQVWAPSMHQIIQIYSWPEE